jgi:hypothetical protein
VSGRSRGLVEGGGVLSVRQRGFEPAEEADLRREMKEALQRLRRFRRFAVGSTVVVIAAGIPLSLGQFRKETGLGILALGTVAIYVGVILWVYVREARDHRWGLAGLSESTKAGGHVRVTRCTSTRVVAVAEVEDEGAAYFFEVEPNRMYFVSGQQFYPTDRFPNDDFEIVEAFDGEGRPVRFEIRCHGAPMRPARTIPAAAKVELLESPGFPEDGDVIEGRLDGIEEVVRGRRIDEAHVPGRIA